MSDVALGGDGADELFGGMPTIVECLNWLLTEYMPSSPCKTIYCIITLLPQDFVEEIVKASLLICRMKYHKLPHF